MGLFVVYLLSFLLWLFMSLLHIVFGAAVDNEIFLKNDIVCVAFVFV